MQQKACTGVFFWGFGWGLEVFDSYKIPFGVVVCLGNHDLGDIC
jgi:hypothetical protein